LLKQSACSKQYKKREENQPHDQWINEEENRLAKAATGKQENT
jgi:hypothetical protein